MIGLLFAAVIGFVVYEYATHRTTTTSGGLGRWNAGAAKAIADKLNSASLEIAALPEAGIPALTVALFRVVKFSPLGASPLTAIELAKGSGKYVLTSPNLLEVLQSPTPGQAFIAVCGDDAVASVAGVDSGPKFLVLHDPHNAG